MITFGYVTPASVEYSSLALAIEPVLFQVTFLDSPTIQVSAPLGEVKTKAPLIVNVPLDTSVTVASAASEIRTFRFVPIASGTVQAYVNGLASVEAVITTVCSSDAKAFVEYSSLTLMNEPVRVQVMFWFAPTIQVSPPLGAVTTTEPLMVKFASD